MTYPHWLMNDVADALGWALVHSVWQGVVVALVLAGVLRAMRGVSSAGRYGLACASLGVVVIGFGVTLVMGLPEQRTVMVGPVMGVEIPVEPMVVGVAVADVPAVSRSEWTADQALPWLVAGWLVGVIVLSVWQFGGWLLLGRYRRKSRPADEPWRARLAELARAIGVRRVTLAITDRLEIPIVVGVFRPYILMPAAVLSNLSIPQVEAILAHELAHVRRYDYLVNLIQSAIETLLFYHPAVWWISKQIRREREFACDEIAAKACGDRLTYAQALAGLEESRVPKLAPAAGGGGRGELLERVRRVLGSLPTSGGRWNWSRSWAATMIVLSICAAIGAMSPWLRAQPVPADASPTTAPTTGPSSSILPEDLRVVRADYVIAPNDLIQLTFSDLPNPRGGETVRTLRVSESGNIVLPYLGEMKAAGLTESRLVQTIIQAFRDRDLIQNANVSVLVTEARGRLYSVMGAVGQPGQFAIVDSDFRLLNALALSRGSVTSDVRVVRPLADPGKSRVIEIPAALIQKGEGNIVIRPGDAIFVHPPREGGALPAGRPANDPELQQALDAAVTAALQTWDALQQRIDGGEAYTPTIVQLQLDLAHRIFEARRAAALSPADELSAAEEYLKKCVTLGEVLWSRRGLDVTSVQISQANSTVAQARALVLRLRAQTQASTQPQP